MEMSTPFILAIKRGHSQIVRLLLDKGASVKGLRIEPNPITLACEHGHYNVFRVLFEAFMKTKQRTEGLLVEEIFPDICASYFNDLVQHLNVLRDAGQFAVYSDLLAVDQEKVDEFNSEIKKMKAIKVWNDVSLYVVFQRYKDLYYLRNQDLLESLEEYLNSPANLEQFPLCCSFLKNRFQSSKYKLTLLTRVPEVLEGQEWWDKLPLLVQEKVVSNLDNTDLEKILRSE